MVWILKHKIAKTTTVITMAFLASACGTSSSAQLQNTTGTTPSSANPKTTSQVGTSVTTVPPPVAAQSTLLAGNARPQFPSGTPGQMSVVYQAPITPQTTGTDVPIVIRNNTSAGVAHVDITASTRDAAGKIIASGQSQGTDPSVIQPGQWALSFIHYDPGTSLAANDTLTFSFQTSPVSTTNYNTAAIQVTQANAVGTSIAGGVQNTTGHDVTGPISIDVYCLNGSGQPTYIQGGFTSGQGDLAANATASFQVDLYGRQCTSFLVGASGYYP